MSNKQATVSIDLLMEHSPFLGSGWLASNDSICCRESQIFSRKHIGIREVLKEVGRVFCFLNDVFWCAFSSGVGVLLLEPCVSQADDLLEQ